MIFVYRGINYTKKEVYHGVSHDPTSRKDGSHCNGGTKALRHWNCNKDKIIWREVSKHYKQKNASAKAHFFEKNYVHPKKFRNIRTKGI